MASRQRLASRSVTKELVEPLADPTPSNLVSLFASLPIRSDADLGLLERRIVELRVLVNDPVALLERARDLIEGTARPLLSDVPGDSIRALLGV